ncbi:hypothetical protein J1614_001360 [Plenodomus biglobosus]|nr:hypothetical protein J1614_001360 [Plenodomus biglobosus]
MSSATQSSPAPHTMPSASNVELSAPLSSSPLATAATPASLHPDNTNSILNHASAATAAQGVSKSGSRESYNRLQENYAPSSHHDSAAAAQSARNGNSNTCGHNAAVTPTQGSALSGNESSMYLPLTELHQSTNHLVDTSPASSSKHNASLKTHVSPRLKLSLKRPSEKAAPKTPFTMSTPATTDTGDNTGSSSGTSRSGLKLKLRCIRSALRESLPHAPSFSPPVAGVKRPALLSFAEDVDETDSEIDIMPKRSFGKHTVKHVDVQYTNRASSYRNKRAKVADEVSIKVEDEAMFDAGDEEEAPSFSLLTPALKRNMRILDPGYAPHAQLIANATKVGPEYYDSDAEDVPGVAKGTGKPHLFRNVNWGSYVTDMSNDADFVKEPEFTQFVPGRFELLPDGTVSDQKGKLVIKLLDKSGRKRVFANPPPRDWNNQEAITALNKRTVQQIRRNTDVRFREVVLAYLPEERRWILANLTAGKPTQGWKAFVKAFNERFEGKVVAGANGTRPYRSHSSLTKEVERFGPQFYTKGLVPAPVRKTKKD